MGRPPMRFVRAGVLPGATAMVLTLGACGDDDGDAGARGAAAPTAPTIDAEGHGGQAPATGHGGPTTGGDKEKAGDGSTEAGASKNAIAAADSGTPEEVVERVLVDHYADATCAELTEAAERQFGYGPGPDCDKVIAERNPPKDVTVSDIQVVGAKGTAVASGFTFKFVRRDGLWLIDGTA